MRSVRSLNEFQSLESPCFILCVFFCLLFFLSVEGYRSCRQVGYSHTLWGNQDTGAELGAELGKVEFRGIFTGRCVCKVLEICCCVFLYCMSKKATLIYIPKTLVTPDVNKILLVKKPIHFIERGHVTWKKKYLG